MLVTIVFRPVSILYHSLVNDCKHVSCVSASFSICFMATHVCRFDACSFLCWRYLSDVRPIFSVSRLKITVPHVSVRLLVFTASFNSFIKFSCNLCVDFCPQFMYFNLNYSFLFFNSTGVGLSILSNFAKIFNHFVNQMLDLVEHSWYFYILCYIFKNSYSLQSIWFSSLQIPQHGHSCSLQYNLNLSLCSLQCSLIYGTYDGNFRYSAIGIVVWPRDSFRELWYSIHSVQSHSSHSRHQTSDGLEIWRLWHNPQKDAELDMMLISCNILLVLTKWKLTCINCF